jgi:hypothetical protein
MAGPVFEGEKAWNFAVNTYVAAAGCPDRRKVFSGSGFWRSPELARRTLSAIVAMTIVMAHRGSCHGDNMGGAGGRTGNGVSDDLFPSGVWEGGGNHDTPAQNSTAGQASSGTRRPAFLVKNGAYRSLAK